MNLPLWARYAIAAVLFVLLSVVVDLLFSAPLSTVAYWVAWALAFVFAMLTAYALATARRGGGTRLL